MREANFFFCPNYKGVGPRVLLLVGQAWRSSMLKHYGVDRPPFFTRPALPGEPDKYPNGHPWGWVYKPDDVLKEEARWTSEEALADMRVRLDREMQETISATAFNIESTQGLAA